MDEEVGGAERKAAENRENDGGNDRAASRPGVAKGADLTGIFRQLDVRDAAASLQQSPEPAAGSSQRGGATDLFRTTGSGGAPADPGFTQIFNSLGKPPGPTLGQAPEDPGTTSSAANSPAMDAKEAKGVTLTPAGLHQGQQEMGTNGFTQMFQSLDDPGVVGPSRSEARPRDVQQMLPTATPQPVNGGFTQLLRTLSSEDTAPLPSDGALPGERSMVQPEAEGPGEFTRIISRSALRGAKQRSEHKEEPDEVRTNEPAPVQTAPDQRPPQSFATPLQSALVQGQAISTMAGAAGGSPLQGMPTGVGSLPLPLTTPIAGMGRLQDYVPLLLIANLFAMLIVILLVSLLLFRHR